MAIVEPWPVYTITTYEPKAYLCRLGFLPGIIEYIDVTPKPKRLTVLQIQLATAQRFFLPTIEMTSARRDRAITRPRQIAMYLARTLTLRSLPEIGRMFGNRDHTTVMHACKQIERLYQTDETLAEHVDALRLELTA